MSGCALDKRRRRRSKRPIQSEMHAMPKSEAISATNRTSGTTARKSSVKRSSVIAASVSKTMTRPAPLLRNARTAWYGLSGPMPPIGDSKMNFSATPVRSKRTVCVPGVALAGTPVLTTTPGPTNASDIGFGHFAPAAMSAIASRIPIAARTPINSGQAQRRESLTGCTPAAACAASRRETDEDRQVIPGDSCESDQSQEQQDVRVRNARKRTRPGAPAGETEQVSDDP